MCRAGERSKLHERSYRRTTDVERLVFAALGDCGGAGRRRRVTSHYREGRENRILFWTHRTHHSADCDWRATGRIDDRSGAKRSDADVRYESADLVSGIRHVKATRKFADI